MLRPKTSLVALGEVRAASFSAVALQAACREGRHDMVEMLLNHYGVSPNASDKYGWTALHVAVLHWHEDLAKTGMVQRSSRRTKASSPLPCKHHIVHPTHHPMQLEHQQDQAQRQAASRRVVGMTMRMLAIRTTTMTTVMMIL